MPEAETDFSSHPDEWCNTDNPYLVVPSCEAIAVFQNEFGYICMVQKNSDPCSEEGDQFINFPVTHGQAIIQAIKKFLPPE